MNTQTSATTFYFLAPLHVHYFVMLIRGILLLVQYLNLLKKPAERFSLIRSVMLCNKKNPSAQQGISHQDLLLEKIYLPKLVSARTRS